MMDDERAVLFHVIEGNGPRLLLLHGWGVTIPLWQNLRQFLALHFQLIMVELPGFGQSRLADASQSYYLLCINEIERLRQELNINRWSILGYSIGARVAEAYAVRFPDHVARVVFLCPAYPKIHLRSRLRQAVWLDDKLPWLVNWLLSGWRKPRLIWFALILATGVDQQNRAAVRILAPAISAQPTKVLKRSLRDLLQEPQTPVELPNVRTLYLWGRNDFLVARPTRPNDVVIWANHNAPLTAALVVEAAVAPFLVEGTPTS